MNSFFLYHHLSSFILILLLLSSVLVASQSTTTTTTPAPTTDPDDTDDPWQQTTTYRIFLIITAAICGGAILMVIALVFAKLGTEGSTGGYKSKQTYMRGTNSSLSDGSDERRKQQSVADYSAYEDDASSKNEKEAVTPGARQSATV
jgi:hypothetical protein